jgi:hypothetical protein
LYLFFLFLNILFACWTSGGNNREKFVPISLIAFMVFSANFIIILQKSFFLLVIFPEPFLTESWMRTHFKADFCATYNGAYCIFIISHTSRDMQFFWIWPPLRKITNEYTPSFLANRT